MTKWFQLHDADEKPVQGLDTEAGPPSIQLQLTYTDSSKMKKGGMGGFKPIQLPMRPPYRPPAPKVSLLPLLDAYAVLCGCAVSVSVSFSFLLVACLCRVVVCIALEFKLTRFELVVHSPSKPGQITLIGARITGQVYAHAANKTSWTLVVMLVAEVVVPEGRRDLRLEAAAHVPVAPNKERTKTHN